MVEDILVDLFKRAVPQELPQGWQSLQSQREELYFPATLNSASNLTVSASALRAPIHFEP